MGMNSAPNPSPMIATLTCLPPDFAMMLTPGAEKTHERCRQNSPKVQSPHDASQPHKSLRAAARTGAAEGARLLRPRRCGAGRSQAAGYGPGEEGWPFVAGAPQLLRALDYRVGLFLAGICADRRGRRGAHGDHFSRHGQVV